MNKAKPPATPVEALRRHFAKEIKGARQENLPHILGEVSISVCQLLTGEIITQDELSSKIPSLPGYGALLGEILGTAGKIPSVVDTEQTATG